MEQNSQSNENNIEIKLDREGEPIDFESKKNSSKKYIALILIFLFLIIAGIVYFTFFNKENEKQEFVEIKTEVLDDKKDEEVEIDKNLDTDQDKLPDYLEKILGTNINNSDTDKDGYSDFDEIKNGYSPITLEEYTEEEWDDVKEKIKGEDEGLLEEMFSGVVANSDFVCGTDTVKDIDNNIYNTVQIGEQCWLKENLKVTKNPAGEAITRYCYDNDPNICDTDGGLYDWNTAMNNSTQEGAQGICPDEWHVPKDGEWYVLENGLKDEGQACNANRNLAWDCVAAGLKLKLMSANEFAGILTGGRDPDGIFGLRGVNANFWSSTESNSRAWNRILDISRSTVARYDDKRDVGLSVRCLKD